MWERGSLLLVRGRWEREVEEKEVGEREFTVEDGEEREAVGEWSKKYNNKLIRMGEYMNCLGIVDIFAVKLIVQESVFEKQL